MAARSNTWKIESIAAQQSTLPILLPAYPCCPVDPTKMKKLKLNDETYSITMACWEAVVLFESSEVKLSNM